MATKTRKKTKKTKKAKPGTTIVAGREVDTTPVEFETASFDDFTFGGGTRKSSKYYNLVQAALELEDGECVVIDVEEDENGSSKRLNIAQVIYNKVAPKRGDHKYRVKLTADGGKIVVGCFAKEETDEDED